MSSLVGAEPLGRAVARGGYRRERHLPGMAAPARAFPGSSPRGRRNRSSFRKNSSAVRADRQRGPAAVTALQAPAALGSSKMPSSRCVSEQQRLLKAGAGLAGGGAGVCVGCGRMLAGPLPSRKEGGAVRPGVGGGSGAVGGVGVGAATRAQRRPLSTLSPRCFSPNEGNPISATNELP